MAYADQPTMSPNKIIALVVVGLLHVLLGYALVTGLAIKVLKDVAKDTNVFDVEEPPPPPEEEPPPPPDEPIPQTEPPPVSPPPLVRTPPINQPPINTVPDAPPRNLNPIPAPVSPTPPPPPAPPAPPPAPVRVQEARARGNLVALFSDDDYPASALRNEEQGTTAVSLTIGPDGRVTGCNVTSSSGSSALDSATCRIIRSRARYTPARDSAGNATTGTDSTRVTWRVPAE